MYLDEKQIIGDLLGPALHVRKLQLRQKFSGHRPAVQKADRGPLPSVGLSLLDAVNLLKRQWTFIIEEQDITFQPSTMLVNMLFGV